MIVSWSKLDEFALKNTEESFVIGTTSILQF